MMGEKVKRGSGAGLGLKLREKISEATIEKAFVEYAESKGCMALKLRIDGQNGFPDRTVLTPRGVFFIEFKTPSGKLRPAQEKCIEGLRKLGFYVTVVTDLTTAQWTLNTVLKGNVP